MPAIGECIIHEEAVNVPEDQEKSPPDFFGWPVAEIEVGGWIMGTVEPSHNIHLHLIRPLIKLDKVTGGFVHGLAVLPKKSGKSQNGLKRLPGFQNPAPPQKRGE